MVLFALKAEAVRVWLSVPVAGTSTHCVCVPVVESTCPGVPVFPLLSTNAPFKVVVPLLVTVSLFVTGPLLTVSPLIVVGPLIVVVTRVVSFDHHGVGDNKILRGRRTRYRKVIIDYSG